MTVVSASSSTCRFEVFHGRWIGEAGDAAQGLHPDPGWSEPSIPDGSVFISYRRGDSAGHTGRLYDGLSAAFGDAAIFVDIDAIDPGVDFSRRIREALATCRVVRS